MDRSRISMGSLLSVTMLVGSTVGVAGQTASPTSLGSGLVTVTLQPGVERVLRDAAGHDLTEGHPSYPRDMDHLAIAPDGTVWVASTAHGSDNDRLDGYEVWALGRPGVFGVAHGVPEGIGTLMVDAAGYLWATGSSSAMFDGQGWSSVASPHRVVAPDGTLWLADPRGGVEAWDGTGFARYLPDKWMTHLRADPDGTVWAVGPDGYGTFDGEAWNWVDRSPQRATGPDGTVWQVGDRGGGLESRKGAATTRYLSGSRINEVAIAPDGTVWVVGDIAGEPGGVYRIRPPDEPDE